MTNIHESSIIAEGAVIGTGTVVGPYSVIGKNVKLGKNNRIYSHVVLDGFTEIGDNNQIFQFASVGAAPQDLKYKGEPSKLIIGDSNIIREYVTIQPGTEGGGMLTKIANKNLFMACTHIGHDAHIGNSNIFANSATLAGHVEVEDYILIGGLVGIHQFVKIGAFSMLAAGAMVSQDVPPFCIVQGDRAQLVGIHQIGLERNGFNEEEIRGLKNLFKELFMQAGNISEKIEMQLSNVKPESNQEKLLLFIKNSQRGICSLRKK